MAVRLMTETKEPRLSGRVHVIGAGPVGLLVTALLQSMKDFSVRLYEKRREYTRTRMVQLAPYLVADSVESYRVDHVDGENVDAVFEPLELDERIAFRRTIPPDLSTLLHQWTTGFCPLNTIESSLSDLIDARGSTNVQRVATVLETTAAMAMLEPGDIVIDSTGSRSLLRDQLIPRTMRQCRRRSTGSGFAPTFHTSLSRWTGSSTRSSKRHVARSSVISRSCEYR